MYYGNNSLWGILVLVADIWAIVNIFQSSASTERKLPEFILTESYDAGFAMALMVKDLGIAVALGEELGAGPALAPAGPHRTAFCLGESLRGRRALRRRLRPARRGECPQAGRADV